jgi:two-component system, NarL family, response regulator DevR
VRGRLARQAALEGLKPHNEVTHLEANKPLRVLIAENHRPLSDLMRELINAEADMACVGQADSAEQVQPMARLTRANRLILDLTLQGGSSLPLLAELSACMPELKIIVFSGLAQTEEASREARRRGAAAFVTKGADFQELLAALRQGP